MIRWSFHPPGTRVRLKVPTIGGWRGTATMLDGGNAIRDGGVDPVDDGITATPYEWAKMRDQAPNPEHAALVERAKQKAPRMTAMAGTADMPSADGADNG